MKRSIAAFVLLCLLAPVARAQSADVQALLDQTDRLYGELDYRGAAEAADKVANNEQATRGQRAHAWEREGLSWLILGQKALAKESLDRLFELDQDRAIEEPSLSPRQKQFIEDVRTEAKAKHPAKVEPAAETTPEPAKTPEKKPLYKTWWLWTAVGVAVVGVGLGVGLGIGLRGGPPKGTLGTVGLSAHW